MGRRALRSTDPSLDLRQHLTTLEDLAVPFRASDVFRRRQPLEVEIGCGKGMFLVSASGNSPDRNFLGIEVSQKYARFTASRLAKAGRDNAIVIHGNAQQFFSEHLTDESVAAVHVYFPDPWWKKRHRKRRVMNERFLRNVQRTLQRGGTLHFWTDVEEYYRSSVELIRQTTRLDGPIEVSEKSAEHDLDYRTHFERRMRLHDQPVYRAEFRKVRLEENDETE